MLILLTNDDGIYAPGLAALERALGRLGDVYVVAPATEQSGVGHSITYLRPLVVNEVSDGPRRRGWAVEGSPADCVKLGVLEYCPQPPDLVVSGINAGLNAGINVLYSGTVAAAIEGAFFGLLSVAVSLEFSQHPQFDAAAHFAVRLIEQLLSRRGGPAHLYNINIPTAALELAQPQVRVVPMGAQRWGEAFERRTDPRGRAYFWAAGGPPTKLPAHETDMSALAQGHITLTPLEFDLTHHSAIAEVTSWEVEA